MREILMLLRANIRASKKNFVSIVVLLFIMSVSVTTVMTVRNNSEERVDTAAKEDGFGDLWASFVDMRVQESGITVDELQNRTEQCSLVDKVQVSHIVWADMWNINNSNTNNSILLMEYGNGGIEHKFFSPDEKNILEKAPSLKKGEVAVPIAYQSLFDCKIGNILHIEANKQNYDLKVKYFIEDPIMGSSMIGLKTLLISEEDMKQFRGICEETTKGAVAAGSVFHVFQSEESNLSGVKFEQEVNKETGLTSYTTVKLTESQSRGYMLILINVFSGVLLGFVVLLVVVSLIIIGHSISNSMELDYVNLGVLKAVGFEKNKLKFVYVLQYMIAVFLGCILGFPCAIPLVSLINEFTKPVTGLQVATDIDYMASMGILLGIICLIVCFIIFKLRKMTQITPVRAIRGGRKEIYFKNRMQAGIRKKGLDFWMAFRQITSNKRQYLSGCLIAALLVFFLGMTSSMKVFIGSDGDNMNALFSAFEEDISIRYYDETRKDALRKEAEELIESYSPITASFGVINQYLSIDGSQINCLIVEKYQALENILKGRVCRYDNEILITEFLAKELEIEIGDSLMIQSGEKKAEYLVSGYYQNSNDMGSNFAMTADGYKRLVGEEFKQFGKIVYQIEDESQVDAICRALEEKYPEEKLQAGIYNFNGLDSIVSAVDAIVVLIYIIATIFVLIAILLICSKLFLKEQKDYGIYKAIGFDSMRLRRQFAVRFSVVAILGGILGVILYLAMGNMCAATIFYFVGVSSFEADTGLIPMILPFVFVAGLFGMFSWLAAGKIKKATPRIMIQE